MGRNVMVYSKQLASLILATAVIVLAPARAFTQTDTTVVAELNGAKLTVADL